MIVSSEGYVLTNNHVIEDADDIQLERGIDADDWEPLIRDQKWLSAEGRSALSEIADDRDQGEPRRNERGGSDERGRRARGAATAKRAADDQERAEHGRDAAGASAEHVDPAAGLPRGRTSNRAAKRPPPAS